MSTATPEKSDSFPKGKRIGIYIPDWDSEFVVTAKGKEALRKFSPAKTRIASTLLRDKWNCIMRTLRSIDRGESNHWRADHLGAIGASLDNNGVRDLSDLTYATSWLLQNDYIRRSVDKSVMI